MRIDEASMFAVENRLVAPFAASSHAAHELTHLLIRLRAGDVVGWGECATLDDPYYLGETTQTAWHIVERFLLPAIVGAELADAAAVVRAWGPVKGNTFAKAGVEMAAHDLFARAAGRSVSALLGGTRTEILAGASLGIERDLGRLCAQIEQRVAEGHRRVKLKVARGHDVAVLEQVRVRFPDIPLMVDANCAYTLDDVAHLTAFDAFGLTMIEQPLAWDDLAEHAVLQRALATPICLDESIRSAAAARHALALGSCRVISIKVATVGGLLEAVRIHDECAQRGVPVWCGGMHDFGVGRAANLALASLPGFSLPGDVGSSRNYFAEDIVEPVIEARGGAIRVPVERPGLGFTVDESRVLARTTAAHRLRA